MGCSWSKLESGIFVSEYKVSPLSVKNNSWTKEQKLKLLLFSYHKYSIFIKNKQVLIIYSIRTVYLLHMTLKEQILELKTKGYSYQQITKTLGCSKSTVSYHLGENQKEKALKRLKNQRKMNPWLHKTERFLKEYDGKKITYNKRGDFNRKKLSEYLSSIDKCYLTGRPIDINDFNTYEFDHIHPRKLGGESSFENLGITRPEANRAKSDLTLDEFIGLCKDVLVNFGYKVSK